MISTIVGASIKNRWLVILLAAMTGFAGWQAFRGLPVDAVPDVTSVLVQVTTQVPALGPEEIERTVTVPIESGLNGVPGVVQVRSMTRYGLSVVSVVFEDGTEIYRARQLVSERLQAIRPQLPAEVEPALAPVSSGLGEIFHYIIEADQVAQGEARLEQLRELRGLQEGYVKPRLLGVKGVAEVNSIGGYERQYHVQPDPAKMARHGIHFSDFEEAIAKVNRNVGGGAIEQSGDQFIVQGSGLFKSLDDIRDVPVKTLENLRTVLIGDVATVGPGRELRTGAALHNGQEVVLGTAMMLLGENSRTVAFRVGERIRELEPGLPKGFHIKTVYDRGELVDSTLETVLHNLTLGAILVIGVLLLLVGNLRAALITAIVIPLSLLITFIAMRAFGISGNLVSLGALDFGIIVDGAVIVLDNCVRHLHARAKGLGRSLTDGELQATIREATLEIRKSAGFGELIIVVVFLPIFAFVGVEGRMFAPMAATFIFAILAALVLSFTFVPALASLLLQGRVADEEPWLMRRLSRLYEPLLGRSLGLRKAVLSLAVAAVLAGALLFTRLGGEFLPQLNEGSIALQFIRPVSVGLSHSVGLEQKSQVLLSRAPEVSHVFGRIGTSEVATDPMGVNISDTYVMLKPREQWPEVNGRRRTKEELVRFLLAELDSELAGQRVLASQPIQLRFNELLEGTRADISLKIFGDDQKTITELAQKAATILEKITGAGDVELEAKGVMSVLEVTPRKELLKRLGVSSQEVLETVETAVGGREVGTFYEGTRRYPIVVRLGEKERSDIETLKELPVGIAGAATLPLKQVAEIRFKETFSASSREQTKKRIAVLVNPRGRDTEGFVKEAQAKVAAGLELPPGAYLEWGGNFRNLKEARSRLALLAPVALVLILLMIFAAFRNWIETGLIFLCVPFALVGGVLALLAGGLPFSISAGVGFVALSGIAVLNGVVLVNYFNVLRSAGRSGRELVLQGSLLRLRPVLMTALVDVFGFVPMALSTGVGAEVQRPLALVVIGGILSSTVLTLVILPVLYHTFERAIVRDKTV
ncbi:MAG: CusA/CzcA family heavy metal efflux RND transporter [Oligoflexia bacterium]|nr:CusA/CzcA family heavy metal efflux RND transporter [Oligoflexia bacterium]